LSAKSAEQEAAAFLARLDPAQRTALTRWEKPLAKLLDAAWRSWPGVSVPSGAFFDWLRERLPEDTGSAEGLEGLKGADLYLAFACGQGEATALRNFEQRYLPEMDASLSSLRLSPSVREELLQQLRQKLLVAEDGAVPRIMTYGGRGDLKRWVRAVATREGLVQLRKNTPEVEVEEEFFDGFPAAAEDLELQHARREYQQEDRKSVV